MRRAFTLIELLIIIGLLGILATIAVLSIERGKDAARLKGAVRDVFAAVRMARSTALVTEKPSVITFATTVSGEGTVSSVEIVSAELLSSSNVTVARDINGRWRRLDDSEEEVDTRQAFVVENRDDNTETVEGGETIEEILFAPVSEEVLKDVCLKVVMDNEEVDDGKGEVNEAKRSMISSFSNVDFLLGKYHEEKNQGPATETEKKDAVGHEVAKVGAQDESERKSVAWQVNGRCDPHTIYVYTHGNDYLQDGWKIRVDRFGVVKIYAPGEDAEK